MLDLWNALQPVLVSVGTPILMVLVGWVAISIQKKTGIDIEAGHRDALHSAIQSGLGLGLSRIGAFLPKDLISTKNAVIDAALSYIVKSVPDAIAHFGLSDGKLEKLIEAKLEVMLGLPSAPDHLVDPAASVAVVAVPATVTVN